MLFLNKSLLPILLLMVIVLIKMGYDYVHNSPRFEPPRLIEGISSDFNNSFYGVSLWNGWPY